MIDLLNTVTMGDARELARLIPDGSIDLIFTDPPYGRDSIFLYGWLAEEAARVLKPGGFLLAYNGTIWKQEIMRLMGQHLEYFYDYVSLEYGHVSMFYARKVATMHKSILAYVKGVGLPRKYVYSVWKARVEDKRYHVWGQSLSTACYFIECFSRSGETVLEPFTGGGTTLYACKQLKRNFISFEVDPSTADIARKRLETVQPLLMDDEVEQLVWEAQV